MSEPPRSVVVEPARGVTASAIEASRQILSTLPPAFLTVLLILVGLNVVFLGMVMWFLDVQIERRLTLLGRILDHCLSK